MSYQNGWAWMETSTPEQREDPQNEAACERLYAEIRHLYESIPDAHDEHARERREMALEAAYEDAEDHEAGEAAVAALQAKWAKQRKEAWGQIEAVEQLLNARGARLKRPYEDWNEDEQLMEYLERDCDGE